jgi:hypothetical protein
MSIVRGRMNAIGQSQIARFISPRFQQAFVELISQLPHRVCCALQFLEREGWYVLR